MSMDGSIAATHYAYVFTELSVIYPITLSSPVAEVVDRWATRGRKNIFDSVVKTAGLQSEGGVAGAVHGVLQTGSLITTFTVSQGLLLVVPNIYKMAGKCLPGVIHVAARALVTRALSIFDDHEGIYACRQNGVCMLASHSVQEAMDPAGVAHLATIREPIPFMHFFDGLRTSHEVQKVEAMDTDVFEELVDEEALAKFRKNVLNPHANPVTRGGTENNNIPFQDVEARSKHFDTIPDIVADYVKKISEITDRRYVPFTYCGAGDVECVIVAMGSVTEAAKETIDALAAAGEKVGMIKVHPHRLFSVKYLLAILPETVKEIAVLDRTKETGSMGEPLCLDILSVLKDKDVEITGGRYGMGFRDTRPYHIKAIFDKPERDEMKNSFIIGVVDDITSLNLEAGSNSHAPTNYTSYLFWELRSNDTVSANKSTVKIIGNSTGQYVQAYFAYDSKKAGGITRSHLRSGNPPTCSTHYIGSTDFVSRSLDVYMFKYDMAKDIKESGSFLLNTTSSKEEIVEHAPNRMKARLAKKHAKFYIVNVTEIAQEAGVGRKTNTIPRPAFLALNEQIMPHNAAVELMKAAAKKSHSKKGDAVVQLNYKMIDAGKTGIEEVTVDATWADLPFDSSRELTGDEYFDNYVATINGLEGYDIPVSAFTGDFLLDGSTRNDIALEEKRTITVRVPTWHPENCIQCGTCSFICPHATVCPLLLTEEEVAAAPMEFETTTPMGKGIGNLEYRIQATLASRMGCGLRVVECPGKASNRVLKIADINEEPDEEPLADYLFEHTEYKTELFPADTVKGSQFMMPYFEVGRACPGCGETPYYKLVSQLFDHDILVANVTGCSMIYCSSIPSTPFVNDSNGEGVAWASFLFEDNTEFGYDMALAQNYKESRILKIMEGNMENVEPALKEAFVKYLEVHGDRDVEREIAPTIKELAARSDIVMVKELADADLVSRFIWIVGDDGWAYDIGYGGLDHVLVDNLNMNILVLDTEAYSSIGGQSSKSSQVISIIKSTVGGRTTTKRGLGRIAMAYGHVYVAVIFMGADKSQTLKALKEAENYDGLPLTLAYFPYTEHGIKSGFANHQGTQAKVAGCGYFDLYRYDPGREAPLTINPKESDYEKMLDFMMTETRYSQLPKVKGETAHEIFEKTKKDAVKRHKRLPAIAKGEM